MIGEAHVRGARDAAARFAIREASVLDILLGAAGTAAGGAMARGAINAASPRLMPALENLGAMPVNAIRRLKNPVQSPADALIKQLAKATPAPLRHPMTRPA